MTEKVEVKEVELPVEANASAVEHVEHVEHDPAATVHVDLVGGNGPVHP